MRYKIGFFKKEIPTHSGQWMGGYFPMRQATGVLDSLYLYGTILFEEDTATAYAFLTYDLVAIDEPLKKQIKQSFENYSDWHIHVFLLATHTHSGPAGAVDTRVTHKKEMASIFGEWDELLFQELSKRSVEGIQEAFVDREAFEYRVGVGEAHGIQTDRNHQDAAGFDTVGVLEIKTTTDKRALLWHFPCHPTILKETNTRFSADLPGAIASALASYNHIQYANGAAGNLSTRYTRKESSSYEVTRMGKQLASTLSTLSFSEWRETMFVNVTSYTFLAQQKEEESLLPLLYSLIQFDELTFLTIPGELTSSWSQKFLEQGVWILGYCNGYEFYFADEQHYNEQTYEANHSFLAPLEAERWMDEVQEQIKKRKA